MDFSEERKWKRRKEKASTSGNLANLYIASKELAEFYQREERFEEALKEYKAAERVAKSIGNKIDIGVANRMIGEVLCCMGEFDEAIHHQRKHLELSKEEGNLVEEQRALATFGRTYFVKAESYADVDSQERSNALYYSQKYYKESLAVCDKLENTIGKVQLMLMKARLYTNLGLTLESEQSEQNVNEAIRWYEKAITLCSKFEFWDELCRGYTVLGIAQFHRKDSAAALRAYDSALKIALKSDSKVQQSCEILLAKSEVLVDLNDLVGAKQVLLKAYKLKNPSVKDREEIERRARLVVAMCDAEDKLISTYVDDFKTRKELHEKIADGFTALSNYPKAIYHYKKMLQCVESLGQSGKELIPCYVSLSQTYKDNKQYDLAYEYFEKELHVNSDNPAEACKTLINMAVILELQHKPMDEVLSIYRKAQDEAKLVNNLKLEASVLQAIIAVQNEHGYDFMSDEAKKELDEVKRQMADRNLTDEEDDGSGGECEAVEIGADICLSDLNDSDDNEEFDRPARPVRKRCARSSTLMKRNEKGETPLHVACEKGSLALVKNLIKQGHPLDVQDAAGWLPLHEACNHGHVKVVEELINAGANINDRGGAGCEGVTPLHDAASSGHLDVIELLLDRGASPLVKTNKGETVLDCLLACRERVVSESGKELDPIALSHFELVAERLKSSLEKVGESTQKLPKVSKTQSNVTKQKRESFDFRRNEMDFRTKIDVKEDDGAAAVDYQKTMKALRRPPPRQSKEYVDLRKSDAPAFLDSVEVGNDWLEDDLIDIPQPPKKRSNDYIGQAFRQSSSSNKNKRSQNLRSERSMDYNYPTKRKRSISCSSTESNGNENIPSTMRENSPLLLRSPNENSSQEFEREGLLIEDCSSDLHISDHESQPLSPELISRPTSNIERQKTLTQFDFSESRNNGFSDKQNSDLVTRNHKNKSQTAVQSNSWTSDVLGTGEDPQDDRNKSVLQELDLEELIPDTGGEQEPLFKQYIKVRIEEELIELLVPYVMEMDNREEPLTASWLINEICSIFVSEEGKAPKLRLKTIEGSHLLEENSVTSFINNREILGEVHSWSPVPLLKQYHEICRLKGIDVNSYVEEKLKSCQTTSILKIKNNLANRQNLIAVLTAVSRHPLKCLILSAFLDEDMLELLAECLSISTELKVLNLKNTGISVEELSYFSEIPDNVWQNLRYLNLSHNPLGDESISHLNNITKLAPSLRYLNLENCDLTCNCVEDVPELFLENLEELNVSYNELEAKGLLLFLRCLDPTRLKSIRVAATGGNTLLRELCLFLDEQSLENLKTIDLSYLNLTDSDIIIFCNSLKGASNLTYLNLTDNPELTKSSFYLLGTSFKNLKTLLFSGADFGCVEPEFLDKFSRCSFTSTSENYPEYMKGLNGFISKGNKSNDEKAENSGTRYMEYSFSNNPEPLNILSVSKEDSLANNLEIVNCMPKESEKNFSSKEGNNLNDSFSFDLNDSFENQLFPNNSEKHVKVTQNNDDGLSQYVTEKLNGSVDNNVENPPINWDDDAESAMSNVDNGALFEDSD